jgi:hypothetical protein
VEPVISERICWEQWGTHRGEQEGESPAFRAGKGQGIPFPIEPDRVTAEGILSEEIIGFRLQNSSLKEESTGLPKTINIFEETPVIFAMSQ